MVFRPTPAERLKLVDRLAARSGADSASIFDAYGLGRAYRKPGPSSSKKNRINEALYAAEGEDKLDIVLEAIRDFLDPPSPSQTSAAPTSHRHLESVLPKPKTLDQRRALEAIWDLFCPQGQWPSFTVLDRKLDRAYGIDALEVLESLPPQLVQPPRPSGSAEETLRLTIAGAAACEGGHEDVKLFVEAVRHAAELEGEYLQIPGGDETPILRSKNLIDVLSLPAAGQVDSVIRLGQLLAVERWGWTQTNVGSSSASWQFSIGRNVRRFRDVADVESYWEAAYPTTPSIEHPIEEALVMAKTKIFIVHGHDAARHEVARFLESSVDNAEVVILGEKANRGQTVIEKFEAYGDASSFAVVLLTPDDVGRSVSVEGDKPRARQNVIFELGYFCGKLGRGNVVVLNKGDVEIPSDVQGLIYIDYPRGNWKIDLAAELRAADFVVSI